MKKLILVIAFFSVFTTAGRAQAPGAIATIGEVKSNQEFVVNPDPVREGEEFAVQIIQFFKDVKINKMAVHITDSEGKIIAADTTKVATIDPKLIFVAPKAGKYTALFYLNNSTKPMREKVAFTVKERKTEKKSRRGKE